MSLLTFFCFASFHLCLHKSNLPAQGRSMHVHARAHLHDVIPVMQEGSGMGSHTLPHLLTFLQVSVPSTAWSPTQIHHNLLISHIYGILTHFPAVDLASSEFFTSTLPILSFLSFLYVPFFRDIPLLSTDGRIFVLDTKPSGIPKYTHFGGLTPDQWSVCEPKCFFTLTRLCRFQEQVGW